MFRFLKRPDCVMSALVKALITPQLHADDADATDDHRTLSFEWWVVRGFLHFLFKLITHCSPLASQRHEFRPSVVAMADRILITVWMISFQVSLFFIVVKDPLCPLWGISPSMGRTLVEGRGGFC